MLVRETTPAASSAASSGGQARRGRPCSDDPALDRPRRGPRAARPGPAPARRPRPGRGCAAGAAARQRAGLHGPALADDRDPVGQPLDLAEDVAGQQHGRARGRVLGDALVEDLLHQRVEPRGRLVEDQQLGVGGEGRDQRDLLPVALGVGAALLGRVELEPLEQLVAAGVARVARPRMRSSRSMVSPPGQVGPQARRRRARRPAGGGSRRRRATGPGRRPWPCRRRCAAARAAPGCVVDLPAPLGPRKPCTSPGADRRGPARRGRGHVPNVLTRPRTSMGFATTSG